MTQVRCKSTSSTLSTEVPSKFQPTEPYLEPHLYENLESFPHYFQTLAQTLQYLGK